MSDRNSVLPKKILLAGNPNSGKTTLFNRLTGLNHKAANYPGVTVETKTGIAKLFDTQTQDFFEAECVDLPGVYSLFPDSEDEKVACSEILNITQNADKNHTLLIYTADSTNLERNLFLYSQLKDLGLKTVLVLNMADLAENRGIFIDEKILSELLDGVPVLKVNSRGRKSVNELKSFLRETEIQPRERNDQFIQQVSNPTETDNQFRKSDAESRYQIISSVCAKAVSVQSLSHSNLSLTRNIDKILLHPILGILIFLAILFIVFQALFSWSSIPMELIETTFAKLTEAVKNALPESKLTDLLTDGIMQGLAGILVFIPQIALLFFFISLMEESGYMARVTYLSDRLMRRFGLNGKSIIPLIGGAACAVPSIMAARTISNKKERLITILVTPLMSCSARLPVYAVMIALVIPDNSIGIFNYRGITLMALYMIGFMAAMISAFVFQFIIKSKEKSVFIMEMPSYKLPHLKNVFSVIWNKVAIFIREAGTVILAISVILWVLSAYAPPGKFNEIEQKYAEKTYLNAEESATQIAAEKLEASYAGILGKTIEPVITPLGYDWKIGIALITSFAAREVFVGTMSTIYSVGENSDLKTLTQKLAAQKDPKTGKKRFTLGTGISLMLFYAFAMQCMSTMAVVKRETGGWKIPLIQFLYMGALAYLSAWAAFMIF